MTINKILFTGGLTAALALGCVTYLGCKGEMAEHGNDAGAPPPECTTGTDQDGDGYGEGCPAGPDCDDSDPSVYPGAKEHCDGKDNDCDGQVDEAGDKNACGTCDPGCDPVGDSDAFPTDPTKDPNLKNATGVNTDEKGDLVLGTSQVNFQYMWIANTSDLTLGSISKVDTRAMKEVGRYLTFTCDSDPTASGCVDVNGKPINKTYKHKPSRTAVDFNMDVWVANRAFDGQPSVTKIANDPIDCIDRNNNGKIDTSGDRDGDGKITVDCNGDGKPDSLDTKCSGSLAGKTPEFVGLDDECVLFTTNYAGTDDLGRSVCLDSGKSTVGASNAWVGTFSRPENNRGVNQFYKINGYTGQIEKVVKLPANHHTYGCMADGHNIIWSTDIYGSLAYFQTISPYGVGPRLTAPWVPKKGRTYHHYGITINSEQHVWLGGHHSSWVLRYKPDRTDFASLSKGTWTRVDLPSGFVTRGIAADNRGKIWVAIQDGGYIFRIPQNIPDGVHNYTGVQQGKGYWPVKADTVIGVGVDFDGNLWAVGHKNDIASRLDVDKAGNVITPATGLTNNVKIGRAPYTYSDFTGYGLMNFVRPQGRWIYQHKPCPDGVKAQWKQVSWNATTPPGTEVVLRVRSGDSETSFGDWSGEFKQSPAVFGPNSAAPIQPNPSFFLQVEFTLTNRDKTSSPVLHDYAISYTCVNEPG